MTTWIAVSTINLRFNCDLLSNLKFFNILSLTATGDLKPCLCYSDRISIKNALRTGSPEDVKELIRQAIEQKPAAHCFENIQTVTELKEMSKIGG